MKILLTGFEPFGESKINPSALVTQQLSGETLPGIELATAILPVELERGPAVLLQALADSRPQAVVCLGLAQRRAAIHLERVALNLLDFRQPDNAGAQVTDQPVVPGGPAAYFTTLPLRAMQAAIQQAGVPAELSLSAGSYLCNQVTYVLLHHLASQGLKLPTGFIHLPQLPEMAAQQSPVGASMNLADMLRALRAALAVLAEQQEES